MKTLEHRFGLCHRCDRKIMPPRDGVLRCGVDGEDIMEHATGSYCPTGRYQLGLGDMIAAAIYWTGIDRVWRRVRRGKPCRCKRRQLALNKIRIE